MDALLLTEDYAGLRNQALGLAEAACVAPEFRPLRPRPPWCWLPAALWPAPLAAVGRADAKGAGLVIGCGGVSAAVLAALRRRGRTVVQIQHPRMALERFDLVVVNHHDEVTAPNVIATRTALHRVTPETLATAAALWAPRLGALPRPLVSVLLGGSNGRFRLDVSTAQALARQLAGMMRNDGAGLALTPSRRTDPAALRVVRDRLEPLGAFVWDGVGDNPYFGLLACADAIVATQDSVSMVSEAAATGAPVMIARLPGRSRRNGLFLAPLLAAGRVRWFEGRLAAWSAEPLNDTPWAAAEMRRRLGI